MESETWPFKDTWSLHGNREIVSRYQILEKIGEGAFADVYRAKRREDNLIVALKEIHDSDSSYREVKALLRLDHPNIIKLYEYFLQGSNIVLVLEYLPSNLSRVIKVGNLSEADVKGWSIQVLQGLSACHAASILHRDIKPANLLIAEDGTLKIADFGTARILVQDDRGIDQYGYGSEIADEDVARSSLNVSEPYENRYDLNPSAFVPSAEAEFDRVASAGLNNESFSAVNPEAHVGSEGGRTNRNPSQTAHAESSDASTFEDPEADDRSPRKHVIADGDLDRNGCLKSSVSVGDGRRYVEMERMNRSGSELMVRSVSASQRTGLQVEDPGCCGWFSLEKDVVSEMKIPEALVESQPTVKGDGYFNEEMGSRYTDKYTSSDESEGSWKDQRRFQDLSEMSTHDAGVESKGDGLNTFQLFLKKRTRRLSSDRKMESREFTYPEHEEEASATEEKAWKEPTRNWLQSSMLSEHSSLTNIFTGLSSEVRSSSSAEMNNGQEEKPLQARGVASQHGHGFESSSRDVIVKHLMTEEQRSKSLKHMANGPLREMADACGPDGTSSSEFVGNDGYSRVTYSAREPHLRPSEGYAEDGVPEKSKREVMDALQKSSKEETIIGSPESEETLTFSVYSGGAASIPSIASRSGAPNFLPEGLTDGSSGKQSGQEFGYESAGSGKLGGASWIYMGEHPGSPSDAEGTRWFGAPEFRDSYMETRNANSEALVSGETGKVDSEFEEWEDVAEGGDDREGDGLSQRTSDRGENKSENGSDFTTMVGTRWYRAPEMLWGATKYGMEVDIWSFGCILGELFSGKPLFPGINDIDQLSRLVRILGSPTEKEWEGVTLLPDFKKIRFVDDRSPVTLRNHLPNISENSLQFLQKVLAYDPQRRPTAAEALEDEYFYKEPFPTPPSSLTLPAADNEPWDSDDTNTASEWGYGIQNVGLYDYPSDSDYDRPQSD